MPNITPLSVFLFLQMVLMGISKLDALTATVSLVITIALIIIDAAILVFFNTAPGKVVAQRLMVKK